MKIYSAYSDGRLRLNLEGELDHHEAKSSLRTIDRIIDDLLPRDCIIDLSNLSFMDSSGIAVILKADRLLRQSGASLALERPPQQVRKVLEVAGLTQVIPLCGETEEECEPC